MLEDMREDFPGINWCFVDITDDVENMARFFKIAVVPTMVALQDRQEIGRHSGSNMMGYLTLLKKLRNNRS